MKQKNGKTRWERAKLIRKEDKKSQSFLKNLRIYKLYLNNVNLVTGKIDKKT